MLKKGVKLKGTPKDAIEAIAMIMAAEGLIGIGPDILIEVEYDCCTDKELCCSSAFTLPLAGGKVWRWGWEGGDDNEKDITPDIALPSLGTGAPTLNGLLKDLKSHADSALSEAKNDCKAKLLSK